MLNEPVKSQGKNHQIETPNNLNAKATSTDITHKEWVGGQEYKQENQLGYCTAPVR